MSVFFFPHKLGIDFKGEDAKGFLKQNTSFFVSPQTLPMYKHFRKKFYTSLFACQATFNGWMADSAKSGQFFSGAQIGIKSTVDQWASSNLNSEAILWNQLLPTSQMSFTWILYFS